MKILNPKASYLFLLLENVYQQSFQICFHNRKLKRVVFKWIACFFSFLFLFKKEYLHHVTSWNLFFVDPPSVEQVQNITVMEGTHVTKECNVTTGTPPINIFWEDVKSGQVFEGKLLNITDITRYQTEYRCIANNTCGWVSTTMFIGVQCKNLYIFSYSLN